jgi:hypothetical protein
MVPRWCVNVFLVGLLATPAVAGAAPCQETILRHPCGAERIALATLCPNGTGTVAFFRQSGTVWKLPFATVGDFVAARRVLKAAGRQCREARR